MLNDADLVTDLFDQIELTPPASAASTPITMRIVVVLPAPLLPTKPKSSPARTCKLRSRSASTSP